MKISLIVHKDKNHYGFKCPFANCTFYTTANDDMMGHRLACHTERNKFDPKLIDDLVEDTKKIKVSEVAKARYNTTMFGSKYDVTKTKLRYVLLLHMLPKVWKLSMFKSLSSKILITFSNSQV